MNRLIRLAQSIVLKKLLISTSSHPFDYGRIIVLQGKPGLGKTHLIDAFINFLLWSDPSLANAIYYGRRQLSSSDRDFFGGRPIIILDDLFDQRQSIATLSAVLDIEPFMRFIVQVYEERRLVIFTTNFPVIGGVLGAVEKVDTTGRAVSRLRELIAVSGEIEILGEDYRKILAQQRKDDDIFTV